MHWELAAVRACSRSTGSGHCRRQAARAAASDAELSLSAHTSMARKPSVTTVAVAARTRRSSARTPRRCSAAQASDSSPTRRSIRARCSSGLAQHHAQADPQEAVVAEELVERLEGGGDRGDQRDDRILVRRPLPQRRQHEADDEAVREEDGGLLVGEVLEERLGGDAGGAGDVVDGGHGVAALGHQAQGGAAEGDLRQARLVSHAPLVGPAPPHRARSSIVVRPGHRSWRAWRAG